ncbi:MAG TPA: histidine triad nucleotide-binding protein [bacterium]|nr:histidine triad nucleotide-binding protein [bacterium]HOL46931.1 histidine triad nucleotide-binding protein [bacterium]HPQ18307.1 histidine triad nucleotide-binding protein [bacterium]
MNNCIFCKIINKEIKSEIVFENDFVIAIKDINPVAPIHLLVLPKKHFVNLLDLNDDNILSEIFKAIKILSKQYNISEKGFRVVNNCNKDGGQTVDHIHFHLLGGRFMTWPPG